MKAPTMPITIVTMIPRGLGPGVMKRAKRPTIRPMTRTPMKPPIVICFSPSDFERRHHRHVVGRLPPVARVDVDAMTTDSARQGRRGEDMVEPPAAVGGAPVVVAVAPPGIELAVVRHEAAR